MHWPHPISVEVGKCVVSKLLTSAESPEAARAWFMGMNPPLDDESPAEVLFTGRARDVMAAARAFISAGSPTLALVEPPHQLWRVERDDPPLRFSQINAVDARPAALPAG